MASGEWTCEVHVQPMSNATFKQLTHLPEVVAQLAQIAANVAAKAGAGHHPGRYGIVVQNKPNTKRARALAHPTDSGGIHLELTQHLLLKAAASSTNKTINAKASGQAITMGARKGDSAGTVAAGGTITVASPESKQGFGA